MKSDVGSDVVTRLRAEQEDLLSVYLSPNDCGYLRPLKPTDQYWGKSILGEYGFFNSDGEALAASESKEDLLSEADEHEWAVFSVH